MPSAIFFLYCICNMGKEKVYSPVRYTFRILLVCNFSTEKKEMAHFSPLFMCTFLEMQSFVAAVVQM